MTIKEDFPCTNSLRHLWACDKFQTKHMQLPNTTNDFQVLHFNTINFGGNIVNQSVPIVLPISSAAKETIGASDSVALYYNDQLYAVLRQPEIFWHRKEERVAREFGTTHSDHPHIKVRVFSTNYMTMCCTT